MRTIHKFVLVVTDRQTIEMPDNSRILAVQEQSGRVCLWALVNTAEPPIERTFRIFGTGHPFREAEASGYVGTCQIGALVWHIFEV